MNYAPLTQEYDAAVADLIRTNLKAHDLDIPGTVYFDEGLDHLSDFYCQPRDLSPNPSGGLTPFSPHSELQEIPVATREQSGVRCFHSRGSTRVPNTSRGAPFPPPRSR